MIRRFLEWFERRFPPHVSIEEGYMLRWHLIPRNRWFNLYLHKFDGPDPGDHFHDHRFHNLTILLAGGYREALMGAWGRWVIPGRRVAFRRAEQAHRIVFILRPTWTLFIGGPTVREWGFWVDGKWIPWQEYEIARPAPGYSRQK